MNNRKFNNKQILIALVCFLGALVFFVTSYVSNKYDKEKEQNHIDMQTELQIEQVENNTLLNVVEAAEPNLELDEEWLEEVDTEYPMYQENFKLKNMKDELLVFVGNDKAGLKENIQKTLYENGYYDYSYAVFENYAEFDYVKNTISFSFSVPANVPVDITVIYYRESKEWFTQIW